MEQLGARSRPEGVQALALPLEDAATPALELGLEGPTAGEFNPRRDQG